MGGQSTRDQSKQTMIQSLRDMGYAFDEAVRAWTSVPPSQRGDKLALIAWLKNEAASKIEKETVTESTESNVESVDAKVSVEPKVVISNSSEEKSSSTTKVSEVAKVAKSEELQADTKDMLRKILLRQLHKSEADSG